MDGQALAQDVETMQADVVHPAAASVQTWVARRVNGQFVPLQTVLRGQTVYLLAQISYTALPSGDTPDQSRFLFARPGTIVAQRAASGSIGRGAVGSAFDHWIKVRVPPMSPSGRYTFTFSYTVGGTATSASVQVQVQ